MFTITAHYERLEGRAFFKGSKLLELLINCMDDFATGIELDGINSERILVTPNTFLSALTLKESKGIF